MSAARDRYTTGRVWLTANLCSLSITTARSKTLVHVAVAAMVNTATSPVEASVVRLAVAQAAFGVEKVTRSSVLRSRSVASSKATRIVAVLLVGMLIGLNRASLDGGVRRVSSIITLALSGVGMSRRMGSPPLTSVMPHT